MKTVRFEDVSPFDIDGTLVLHELVPDHKHEFIRVEDPLHPGQQIRLAMHQPMIRLLKEARHRGSFVIVWSKGGYQWAKNVVNALGLEPYVHLVMSKPRAYYDDKDVSEWLKERVYLEPNVNYKKSINKE